MPNYVISHALPVACPLLSPFFLLGDFRVGDFRVGDFVSMNESRRFCLLGDFVPWVILSFG